MNALLKTLVANTRSHSEIENSAVGSWTDAHARAIMDCLAVNKTANKQENEGLVNSCGN
jgi:hypothetical protein